VGDLQVERGADDVGRAVEQLAQEGIRVKAAPAERARSSSAKWRRLLVTTSSIPPTTAAASTWRSPSWLGILSSIASAAS
jgi:hypothetical protein